MAGATGIKDNRTMNDFVAGLIAFLLIVGVFFLTRSIMLWYWRVNELFEETYEIKKYLYEQKENQQKIIELLEEIKNK